MGRMFQLSQRSRRLVIAAALACAGIFGTAAASVWQLHHDAVALGDQAISLLEQTARTQAFSNVALAQWHRQSTEIAGGTLCALLCLLLLLRRLIQQFEAEAAAQDSLQEAMAALEDHRSRLARESDLLRNTLAHMDQGLMMVDDQGYIAVFNHRALDLLQLPAELLVGRPHFTAVVNHQRETGEFQQHDPDLPANVSKAIVPAAEQVYERRRPNGTILEIRSTPLETGGMVRTFTDITARKAAEAMLCHAAQHDQLTGIANRAAFQQRLQKAVARGLCSSDIPGCGERLAVLYLDLDCFKQLNDSRGHAAGDALLAQVATRMRGLLRDVDVVARMGGDEFAVLLCGMDDITQIEGVAQRLLHAIQQPFMIESEPASVGVSIGIAQFPADGTTPEALQRRADAALYQAKGAGRNTWRHFEPNTNTHERRRMVLEQNLQIFS